MYAKHEIWVTTVYPNGNTTWTRECSYGVSEDSALRSYLAFQTEFYVQGGNLETTANLLAATFRRDGSYRTHNPKNERKRKQALDAFFASRERMTDAYYNALRRDNPGW